MKGKEKCKILKEIRQKIATENDIPFVTSECKHQGDCRGTCPKCEAELLYLENELAKRRMLGKRIAVAGLVASFTLAGTACGFEQIIELGSGTSNPPVVDDGGALGGVPDDDGPLGGEPPIAYEEPSVVLYNDTVTLQEDDEPYLADGYVYISNYTSVIYASENEAVFKVDENGTIFPVAPGTANLKVAAFGEGGGETVKEMKVVIREIWNPTDPDTKEVVEIMRNAEFIQIPLSFYTPNFKGTSWDTRLQKTDTAPGPVEIWGDPPHLQLMTVMPKSVYDATVKHGTDEYNHSFQMFIREHQDAEDNRTNYEKIDTSYVPWSIYGDPTLTIYRLPFYDSNLRELVEAGKTYDVVMVVYEGDEVRAWGSTTMEWTDSCELFVKAAEDHPEVIK